VHTTLKVIDKGPRKVKELLEELVTIAKDKGQLI
jgi:hypothetical protein